MDSIAARIDSVRERMARALQRSGRSPAEVELLAVTKTVDAERINEAILHNIHHIGENRVQEFLKKADDINRRGIDISLIGQLQTNKVKYVTHCVQCIQSLDRLALAREVDRQAAKAGLVMSALLQINIGRESGKGGVMEEDIEQLLGQIGELAHIRIDGLMCVPPAVEDNELARPYFARMRQWFEKLSGVGGNVRMKTLSMGMTHDFEVAIEEGATMVRVGSAIFGGR